MVKIRDARHRQPHGRRREFSEQGTLLGAAGERLAVSIHSTKRNVQRGRAVDFLIVFLLIILTALAGAALFLLRELQTNARRAAESGGTSPNLEVLRVELDTHHQADFERLRNETRRVLGEIDAELTQLRDGVRSSHHEHDAQMEKLRNRFVEVDGQTSVQLDRAVVDLRSNQDASIERLREAVAAALSSLAGRGGGADAAAERRNASLSGLYRRLATLEAGFVSITNPGLLPGESFSLPATFTPESLVWETWKAFGDSVFSFAEVFNEERIHLDDQTVRDVVSFLTDVRHTLTRSVFPTLPENPDQVEEGTLADLRGAIMRLGSEISDTRARIERAYRDEHAWSVAI